MVKNIQVKDLVRIFVKGGIISPGDFLKILLVAEKLGAEYVHFGSRQDILFPAKEKSKEILDETFRSIRTDYEINTFEYHNILSSYVAQDILNGKHWLASHIYHYVLDSFTYRPKLRINIVDPSQSLVPLFTGQINFIASNQENYWFVYLRFQHIQNAPWQFPMLVYTEDLSKLAFALEEHDIKKNGWEYNDIQRFLEHNVKMNTMPVTEDLVLPETHFPYYEGFNRLPDGKYWLGLYWRDNKYRTSILKAIMEQCIATEVGKVSLTPWKSFIIKGIFEKDLFGWEKLMGKFGMNLRHSALELNWHLPALDQDAMDLKLYLVRELDKLDISTTGLTFSIKTKSDYTPFTSVLIEEAEMIDGVESYNILYSKDFNPNLTDYQVYADNIPKSVMASLIVELSRMYFENVKDEPAASPKAKIIKDNLQKDIYQCIHCQTVYDSEVGDIDAGIGSKTSFRDLPEDYVCPTCGGKKDGYKKMQLL